MNATIDLPRITLFLFALALCQALAAPPALRAQIEDFSVTPYMVPAQVLVDLIDASPTPAVATSPDNQWLLIMHRPDLPSIEELAQPELRLAGLRINPRTSGPSREQSLSGLTFQRLDDGKQIPVTGLPDRARLTSVQWSPDGTRVAFVVNTRADLDLWAADLKDGKARRILPAGQSLNATMGRPYEWLADSKSFVVRLVPADRGPEPQAPLAPAGPNVQENLGLKTPARTLQDLLQNAHDELLFDHYMTSQVAELQWNGKLRPLGEPVVVRSLSPSPDGAFLLVECIRRPYSYALQFRSFPLRVEVWNRRGELVHLVADLPLQDQVPLSFGSVPTGPRSVSWRADVAAELVWVEALDGGDGGRPAEQRDRVVTLAAPFKSEPIELIILAQRFGGVMWGDDDLALVGSWWWATRNRKGWLVKPGDRAAAPRLVEDRSFQDRYNDPGQPLMRSNPYGRQVLLTGDQGRTLFMRGAGASPEGDRPFLDAWDIATDEKTRLFRSEAPHFEISIELVDPARRLLLTRRESQTEPPNYFLRDLAGGELTQITDFPDPTPQLAGVQKELIHYERADGVPLTGTLYLPAGYDPASDGPLPVLMWAYPSEFKNRQDAGQVTDSPYRFTRVGWCGRRSCTSCAAMPFWTIPRCRSWARATRSPTTRSSSSSS